MYNYQTEKSKIFTEDGQETFDLVIKMYNEGNKQIDISKFFGCDRATICKIMKEFNITKIKLKDKIIDLSNQNFSRTEISKKLNISYSIVKYHLGKIK